jgi:hypothetical protein
MSYVVLSYSSFMRQRDGAAYNGQCHNCSVTMLISHCNIVSVLLRSFVMPLMSWVSKFEYAAYGDVNSYHASIHPEKTVNSR